MEDELSFLEMQVDLNILEKGEKLNILTNRRQKNGIPTLLKLSSAG